jgi:hypothetical protein
MVVLLPRAPATAGLLMLLGVVARTGAAVQVGGYLSEADVQRFEAIAKGERVGPSVCVCRLAS